MILPQEDVCWVVQGNGTRVPFDGATLARSVSEAFGTRAEEFGLLAESIAAAVEQFARDDPARRRLTTVEIAEMVEAVLDMLGLEEWADAYRHRHRPAEIALDQVAARADAGFELEFYRQLDAELGVLAERRGVLRLCGLRDCVLRLRGTRRWGDGCRRLAEEIVQYVYARTARLRGPGAVSSVSVVE